MSTAPPSDPASARRTLLTASIIAGVLTTGGTAAGNFVNLLKGPIAVSLAVTGAVLAGTATVVALLVSAPAAVASIIDAKGTELDAPQRAVDRLHPLAALRAMRLPIAAVLVIASPSLLPYPSTAFSGSGAFIVGVDKTPGEIALILGAGLLSALVLMSCAIAGFNTVHSSSGKRSRGNGVDSVASFTASAGIGVWQWEAVSPAWGIAAAGLVLLAMTLFTGLVEDDMYRYGGGPVILVLAGASAGWVAVYIISPSSPMLGLAAVFAAALVVVPAGIRGRWPSIPSGAIEVVTVIVGMVLSINAYAPWLASPGKTTGLMLCASVVVTVLSLVYSWRYPQQPPMLKAGFWFLGHGKILASLAWTVLLVGLLFGGRIWYFYWEVLL